jgi:predicted nucleotidyltransferase
MNKIKIRVPRKKLEDFCRRNHIRKLAFFRSVLRDDFGPESDVDVLVEFEPGHTPGFAFVSMAEELEKILGREVDLLTFKGVEVSRNSKRKKAVLESAKIFFVA